MKLQITKPEDAAIQGYENITFNSDFDLSQYPDNSFDEILANGILDLISLVDIATVIKYIVSKLRIGGRISVGGTDIRLFAKSVLTGHSPLMASNTIKAAQSMTERSDIENMLRSIGLHIHSVTINGDNYEITAVRQPQNQN